MSAPLPASSSPSRPVGDEIRSSIGRIITGWACGAIFIQLSSGPVFASFTQQLNMDKTTFGFLAGVASLFGFFQLIAARLLERRVGARAMMLWAGLFCRGLWTVAALLPFVHQWAPALLPRAAIVPAFTICLIASAVGQAFTGPPFFVWMSALVPTRVGATFWAKRHQVGTIAGIGAVLVGGWLADQGAWVKAATHGAISPLLLYSAILFIASLFGIADIAAFFRVREPLAVPPPEEKPPLWESFKEPLRERTVRRYFLFTALAYLGFATTGPMTTLFCLEHLELSRTQTGLLITIGPLIGIALSAPMWGRIARAHGTRPMLRFSSLFMVFVPVVWLLATKNNVWFVGAFIALSGAMATAYEISNLQFITRAVPHLPRPTLTALFWLVLGVSFALGTTLGGWVAQELKGWHWQIGGFDFVNYQVVFAFSLLPRIANAFWIAPRLEEPDATPTREAVREVGRGFKRAVGEKLRPVAGEAGN